MSSFTTTGIVSATPTHPSIGWNNSWVVVENNANRELYAQAMYVTNLDDIQISLSAGDIKVDAASAVLITNPVTAVEVLNPLTSVSISNEVEIYTSQTLSVSGSVTILNPVTSIEVTVDQVTISNPVTAVTILNPVTSIEVVVDQVTVSNPVTAVTVLNPVTSIEVNIDQVTISNPVTAVTILNPVTSIDITVDQVTISNPVTAIELLNAVTAVEILNPITAVEIHTDQTLSVSGFVTILNPVTSIEVVIDQVTITNPVTAVTILNPISSFSVDIENVTVSNPVTAVTILNPISSFSVDIENVVISNPVTAVQIINTGVQPLHFQYADNGHLDAFSRLRVSTPTTLFDSKTLHNKSSLFWSQVSSGNGSFIGFTGEGVDASVTLSTLNAGEFAIRQTTQRFNYQPGKSQLALFTGILKPEDHCIKRYGLFQSLTSTPFTPTVGLYFETQIDSPSSIAVIQANEGYLVPSISATRDNWNIDKLDGKGISGKILSLSAANIFLIDFEWLGVGRVRYGAVIDGQICYCHQFNNAGNVQGAYIRTPNLPVRAEIRQLTYSSSNLKMICCSVMSEGGEDFTGVTRAIDSGTIGKTINAGARRAILGARLQANKLDSVNEILNISGLVLASNSGNAASACFKYELLHNPTLVSGGTWTDVDVNSNFQEWQGTSEILNNGTVITSGYSGAGGVIDLSGYRFEKFLRMGCTIDGRRDEMYLVITPLQANEGVFGSITFIESD